AVGRAPQPLAEVLQLVVPVDDLVLVGGQDESGDVLLGELHGWGSFLCREALGRHGKVVHMPHVALFCTEKKPKMGLQPPGCIGLPGWQGSRAEAPKLASLLVFATRPRERAIELERALLAADLSPTLAVELRDLLLLERTGTRYTDLGAWIYDIDVLTTGREPDVAAAKADALKRWRETRSLPWLVAALMHLGARDDDLAAGGAAARTGPARRAAPGT